MEDPVALSLIHFAIHALYHHCNQISGVQHAVIGDLMVRCQQSAVVDEEDVKPHQSNKKMKIDKSFVSSCSTHHQDSTSASTKESCMWSGRLKTLSAHLSGCGYVEVKCAHRGCGKTIKKNAFISS